MLFTLYEGDHDINRIWWSNLWEISFFYQSTVPTRFNNYQYGLKISTFSLTNINLKKFFSIYNQQKWDKKLTIRPQSSFLIKIMVVFKISENRVKH